MSIVISLIERSKSNASLVCEIMNNKQSNFYECTIHNMYYSVYQRMKALLCLKNNYKEENYISHTNRKTRGVEEKGIIHLCIDYIKTIDNQQQGIGKLYKVKNLYRARLIYDYKEAVHIEEKQYNDYYNIMKEANNYLDKYVN